MIMSTKAAVGQEEKTVRLVEPSRIFSIPAEKRSYVFQRIPLTW